MDCAATCMQCGTWMCTETKGGVRVCVEGGGVHITPLLPLSLLRNSKVSSVRLSHRLHFPLHPQRALERAGPRRAWACGRYRGSVASSVAGALAVLLYSPSDSARRVQPHEAAPATAVTGARVPPEKGMRRGLGILVASGLRQGTQAQRAADEHNGARGWHREHSTARVKANGERQRGRARGRRKLRTGMGANNQQPERRRRRSQTLQTQKGMANTEQDTRAHTQEAEAPRRARARVRTEPRWRCEVCVCTRKKHRGVRGAGARSAAKRGTHPPTPNTHARR